MNMLVTEFDDCLVSKHGLLKVNLLELQKFSKSNVLVVATMSPYRKIAIDLEMLRIPYDYVICKKDDITLDKNGCYVYLDSYNRKDLTKLTKSIEAIRRKEKINTRDIFTIATYTTYVDMIEKYNGYTTKCADSELKDIALDTVSGVDMLVKRIESKTVFRRR